jgi:hypothetical protein
MTAASIFSTSYSVTEVNKSGSRVYDDAWVKGGVEITRRGQRFALVRQDYLDKLIEEAREGRPTCLADLLADYDPEKIKEITAEFAAAPSVGKEML